MKQVDILISVFSCGLGAVAQAVEYPPSLKIIEDYGVVGCLTVAIWALIQDRVKLLRDLKESREKYERHIQELLERYERGGK